VASFGDPFSPAAKSIAYEDELHGVYHKLVVSDDGSRLVGGILVGDTSAYARLVHLTRAKKPQFPEGRSAGPHLPGELLGSGGAGGSELPDDAQVCSCNNVLAGTIRARVREGAAATVAELKACTKAGS